jgi:hypothetical protein
LQEASREALAVDDRGLVAGILAINGMTVADRGRHLAAAALLASRPKRRARRSPSPGGVVARNPGRSLLAGQLEPAQRAAGRASR